MSLQYIVTWLTLVMLSNIKQVVGLKTIPTQVWLGLALFSLINKQESANTEIKLLYNLLVIY